MADGRASVGEWPDEGVEGSIDLFRETEYAHVDYLVAERGVWSGFPDPPSIRSGA